jgi:long-chain fatty acid transport protein
MRLLSLSPLARALVPACALCALAVPGRALASGLDAPIITSGQSNPTARDAAAIYWNPANLGYLKKGEVFAGVGLIVGDIRYDRERLGRYQTPDTLQFNAPIDDAYIDAMKSGGADQVKANPIAPSGNLFFAYPVLKDRLALGLGVYVPFAAALKFPMNGAQSWQVQQAFIATSHIHVGAGVRINDYVSLGAGVAYVLGFAELRKKQDFGSVQEFADGLNNLGQQNSFGPAAPSEVRELDVLSRPFSLKKAIAHGVTFNVGITVNPTKRLNIGLTYFHSTAMKYRGQFAADLNDPFFTQDLVAQGLQFKPFVTGAAQLEYTLPKRITLGLGYDIGERWRVDGFVQYVRYSELDAFRVTATSPDLAQPALGIGETLRVTLPRNWRDTVWVEASGRFRVTERMLVSATLGYQSPASPDKTIDTTSPDGQRIIGAIGGVIDVGPRISLLADARFQGIAPRTVRDSDYDLGNGTYRLFIATLAGHLRARF